MSLFFLCNQRSQTGHCQEEDLQTQLAMVVPVVKKTRINYRERNALLSSIMQFDHADLQKKNP